VRPGLACVEVDKEDDEVGAVDEAFIGASSMAVDDDIVGYRFFHW
jgi:hypothetical protein